MICYRCGAEVGDAKRCPSCGANLSVFLKARYISNAYYNLGLEQASVRNLSGAVVSLKNSLKFNKNNINARNLLGLVYCEMGEVVDALSEWVISRSYQSENNLANRYLDEIQQNRGHLDTVNQTIKKYNQALHYCRQDSRDLAIIQLKKVLSLNPKLIKAHQLLALLYLQEGKLELAKKTLRNAGKIDTDNTTTLRYLKEVNARLKEKSPAKKNKDDDLISYQSGNETIIMPKRFKESSIGSSLIYIVIGLIVGTAVTAWLIVPSVRDKAKEAAKQQIVEASDTIATNGQTIKELEGEIVKLQDQLETEADNNAKVKEQTESYEYLLTAYVAYDADDITSAGKALDKVNTKYLSKNAKEIYTDLNGVVQEKYLAELYREGYSFYQNGKYEDAIKNLKKVVKEQEDYNDGSAAYYLAQAYRRNGDLESAKPYYQYVIDNHPNTERARTSQNYVNAQE
ncbi:MAG: tetratricopeptide repeat protein [Lachnospiraceae bacterium]|nr:tetratricopeptide repeat protein [Agathobacter sp.]MDD6291080.1 tetratricopeptide repeat protein [Lachnospiraceae bacterium]